MSARDELFSLITGLGASLCGEFCGGDCDCEESDAEEAKRLIDAHAHELAEQIRAAMGSGTYKPGVYFHGGMNYAADIIDPEVP